MVTSNEEIKVDYYKEVNQTIISIYVKSYECLRRVKNLFVKLKETADFEIDFLEFNNVKATGIDKLILQSVSQESKGWSEKRLKLINHESRVIFHWRMSCYDWETVVCRIQALQDKIGPGSQYLTEEDRDDAVVEFTFTKL